MYCQDFKRLNEIEKEHIVKAIKETNGNLTHAARLLHIGRATIYRKLNSHNIDMQPYRKLKLECG